MGRPEIGASRVHDGPMYPDASPTTAIEVDHQCGTAADEQAAARPTRCHQGSAVVGYARVRPDPADLRVAIQQLRGLAPSEHIYLDRTPAGGSANEGLLEALAAVRPGGRLVVASLARLARSLPALMTILEQLERAQVALVIGEEPFGELASKDVVRLLSDFQLQLVDDALADAAWASRHRHEKRGPDHRLGPVPSVWLRALFDAGMPRRVLGGHFGISRATVFRVADPVVTADS